MGRARDAFSTDVAARSGLDAGSIDLWERHMARGTGEAALDTVWLPTRRRGSPGPTAVVLHGGRGLFGDADAVLPARALVAAGLDVLLVRGLAEPAIDPDGRLAPGCAGPPAARVAGLLDWLVDGGRRPALGIVGISVGGAVALELASRDARVRAVASCFAPSSAIPTAMATNAPPVLLLHGCADAAVPVGRAAELEGLLRARGSEVERVEYADEGHGLTGPAQLDAVRRIAGFLLARLAPG